MKEGRENFDEKGEGEYPATEISYVVNGQPVAHEELGSFSGHEQTEYGETLGANEFPLDERLRSAATGEDYQQITADLEAFYVAQIAALEGETPATLADVETVEFAQMIKEYKQEAGAEEVAREITTSQEATDYLRQPGLFEGLNGKARRLLAIAFSATAFSAAMPAQAQGLGGFGGQLAQYGIQRVIQEVQVGMQAKMQLEQLKNNCDQMVSSIENNTQMQVEHLQLQHELNLSGVALSTPDAMKQFKERNPHLTPQQISAFTQVRNATLNAHMQVKGIVTQCNAQMQQLSQGAAYSRTMRILGDIPVLVR